MAIESTYKVENFNLTLEGAYIKINNLYITKDHVTITADVYVNKSARDLDQTPIDHINTSLMMDEFDLVPGDTFLKKVYTAFKAQVSSGLGTNVKDV